MDAQEDIFIAELRSLLMGDGVETSLAPNLGGEHRGLILRALLPLSGRGERVLTDIALSGLTPEFDLVHIHTIVILKVGDGANALREAAALWNESCPLGAFNVNSAGNFAHRLTLPVAAQSDGGALARQVYGILKMLSGLLAQFYPEAARLSWPENG
ncbi:MAG: hypothetical protein J5449_11225 [Oscillospiraceae bacterium]|nr:hypothetical protein [Oscillospiraceae bacterium]